MSDLVKRLRTPVGYQDLPFIQEEAADRIEELEQELAICEDQRMEWREHCQVAQSKLEKAVEALKGCILDLDTHARDQFEGIWFESDFESLLSPYKDALAELKGKTDD